MTAVVHRIFEDNVLNYKWVFYENCMATLVVMANVHEKNRMTFSMKLLSQF